MDLIGGYGSDSDSDNDAPTNSQKPTVPTALPKPAAPTPPPSSSQASGKQKTNKKGKRLLKLQAVLPEHIWNQLSNANTQQDSDDEDDDGKESRKKNKASATKTVRKPGDNADLTNLLSALPKSKHGTNILSGKSILGEDPSNTITGAQTASYDPPKKETLGSAFLTSTVETVRTKKSDKTPVVTDIHNQRSNVKTEDDVDEEEDEEETTTPAWISSSVSSVPRPNSVATPIPSARTAAPTIAARYNPQASFPTAYGTAYSSAHAYPPSQQQQFHQRQPPGNQKSRKRQMEAMLRQGNLEEVSSDVHLHGQDNVYQPPQEDRQATYNKHGVRVVPTTQYNVGMGATATSVKITGKQRSKHQVNALLASAAALEAQRARNPVTQQNTHRTNAKRKYGW